MTMTCSAGHPKANTIAFGLWHYARTEDNVVRYLLQDRRPTVHHHARLSISSTNCRNR